MRLLEQRLHPGKDWIQIQELVTQAIRCAPAVESYEANVDLTTRYDEWQITQDGLYTHVQRDAAYPEFTPNSVLVRKENKIFTPSADIFYKLLLVAESKQMDFSLSDPRLIKICQATLEHERDHYTAAMANGAHWGLYGIEILIHNINAFMYYYGTLPIQGYVEMMLAPEEPSDADLSSVGLSTDLYTKLLHAHINPIHHVLLPWYEAGVLPWPAAENMYIR